MAENPTFQIPKEVIEPIIQAQVLAAVSNALGGHSRVLEATVAQALNGKVDNEGKPSSYGRTPFLEYLVSETLRQAVKASVVEAIEGHRDTIRAAVLKEMQKKNSPLVKQLIDGMMQGMFDPSRLRYSVKVQVEGDR